MNPILRLGLLTLPGVHDKTGAAQIYH